MMLPSEGDQRHYGENGRLQFISVPHVGISLDCFHRNVPSRLFSDRVA